MRRAKLAPVLLAACLSVVVSGCGAPAGDSKAGATESDREINIGLIGLMSDVPIAIAMERGYFDSVDVKLKIQKFKSGGDMVAPMASGDLDIGGGAFSAGMVNGVNSGNPLVIVADKGSFPTPALGSQQFVVRTALANEIKDFSDLADRKIGVGTAVGTAPYSGVVQALQEAGIADPQSQITSMASSDMVVALDQASVDAAWLSEPSATLAIAKGYAVPWKTAYDVAPGEQDSTIFFNGDWAEVNPELAQSFMDAYVCGVSDYLAAINSFDERKKIIQILSDYTDTPVDILNSAQLPGYFESGTPDVESIQHIVQSFKDLGQIKTIVPVEQLVDLTYVKAAAGAECK
jgi:NitT/TauT family transport system substrate-binding protein